MTGISAGPGDLDLSFFDFAGRRVTVVVLSFQFDFKPRRLVTGSGVLAFIGAEVLSFLPGYSVVLEMRENSEERTLTHFLSLPFFVVASETGLRLLLSLTGL